MPGEREIENDASKPVNAMRRTPGAIATDRQRDRQADRSIAHSLRRPSVGMVVAGSLGCWASLAILSQGGGRLVCAVLVAGALIFALGWELLRLLGRQSMQPTDRLLLAMPAGLITVCGLAQAAHHVGLPLPLVFAALATLAAPGLAMGLADLRKCWGDPVKHGWWHLAAIALIGLAYYLPKATS